MLFDLFFFHLQAASPPNHFKFSKKQESSGKDKIEITGIFSEVLIFYMFLANLQMPLYKNQIILGA